MPQGPFGLKLLDRSSLRRQRPTRSRHQRFEKDRRQDPTENMVGEALIRRGENVHVAAERMLVDRIEDRSLRVDGAQAGLDSGRRSLKAKYTLDHRISHRALEGTTHAMQFLLTFSSQDLAVVLGNSGVSQGTAPGAQRQA